MPRALPRFLEGIFGIHSDPAPTTDTGLVGGAALGSAFAQPAPPMPEMGHNPGSGEWSNIPFDPNWQQGGYEYDPGRPNPAPQNLREYGITSGAIRPTDPLTALRPVQEYVNRQVQRGVERVEPALPWNLPGGAQATDALSGGLNAVTGKDADIRDWLDTATENVAGGTVSGFIPTSTSELIGETLPGVGAWRGAHGFGVNWAERGPAYAVKDALIGAEKAQKASAVPDMMRDAAMRRNEIVAAAAAKMAAEGNVSAASHHLSENLEYIPARRTPISGPWITQAPQFAPEMANPNLANRGGMSIAGTAGLYGNTVQGVMPGLTASAARKARAALLTDAELEHYFKQGAIGDVAQTLGTSGKYSSKEEIFKRIKIQQAAVKRDYPQYFRPEGGPTAMLNEADYPPEVWAIINGGGNELEDARAMLTQIDGEIAARAQQPATLERDGGLLELNKRRREAALRVQELQDAEGPRRLVDQAMRAEGSAHMDMDAIRKYMKEHNELPVAKGSISKLDDGTYEYWVADGQGTTHVFNTLEEAIDAAGPPLERSWTDVNQSVFDANQHYLDMSLQDLEYEKQRVLQNIYDPNRASERLHGDVPSHEQIKSALEGIGPDPTGEVFFEWGGVKVSQPKKGVWEVTDHTGQSAKLKSAEAPVEVVQDLLREAGIAAPNPTDEFQAYNELRRIQAAIDVKTGRPSVLSDALNNIVRAADDGTIEYLHAGFNPFPYLAQAVRKLAAASSPGVGPYRGLTREVAQLGAMNIPELAKQGSTSLDEAVKLAETQALAPGKFYGPEGSLRRKMAGAITPSVNMPHAINVANQAAAGVNVRVASEMRGKLMPIVEDFTNAWAENPAHLNPEGMKQVAIAEKNIGRALTPEELRATYLQWPELFEGGHPDLPIIQRAIGVRQAMGVNEMRELFNSGVELYQPGKLNGVYLMHLRSRAKPNELQEALGKFRADMSNKPGIAKSRAYDTILERLQNPNTAKDWAPETDLRILADMHSRALAREAAINTFQQGAGGLTKTQVIDLEFPGLRRARNNLRNRMTALRGRLDTATRGERNAANQGLQTLTESKAIAERMDALETRINNLGDDYGPELSYLSGQYHELEILASKLINKRNALTMRASGFNYDIKSYRQQMDFIRRDLKDLVDKYKSANVGDKGWAQAAGTNRYWDNADAIKAVERFSKAPEMGWITRFLFGAADEAHAWQLGPDFSPLSIQGGMLGVLSHPITAFREAGKLSQAWHMSDDVLFGPQNIDPAMRELWEFTTKTPLTGRVPISEEVRQAGRGLERVPKIGKGVQAFNEGIDRTLLYFRYKMWENDVRSLVGDGMPIEQAASEAWAAQGKLVPQIPGVETGRRSFLGHETEGNRLLRAAQTSASFTFQPFNFSKDYVRGIQAMLTPGAQMTGRQKLAVKRGTTMFIALSAITAASAAEFDDGSGRSVEERMLAAIDPRSSDFWKLRLPDGKSIPLGGPFRRAYRGATNIAKSTYETATGEKGPSNIADALFSYGQSGLPNYLSTPTDVARNKDFYGRPITDSPIGDPQWFADVGQYALEQVNITGGVPMRAVRTGEGGSPEDIAIGLASQFGGVNLLEQSPATEYRNKLVTQGIPELVKAGIIPAQDVDGKPITSLDQLGSGEYDAVQRWLATNDPQLNQQRKQYQLDREQLFALKDVERKGIDAKYTPAYDALYHELLTGARPSKQILDDLALIRADQHGAISKLYDDKEYRKALADLPDNAMRKLEDDWFNIPTTVTGYVAGKPLTEEQWVEAEQKQSAFLQELNARQPGLADRFQKNLELRDSVVDSHPIIKLKREVDTASDVYYSVGPEQRKQMLADSPQLNIARWVLYGNELHSIAAADALVHQTFHADPNSQMAKAMQDLDLSKRDVKVELNGVKIDRPIQKDIPLWDTTKNAINNYTKTDPADRSRILDAVPTLNAALVYWGALDNLHSNAAATELDKYMSRLNWPLWSTTLKPQVIAYMQLDGRARDQVRVQYPNVDAAWGVFQNYLTGAKPTLRSEAARKEYARIMGIREGSAEYKLLDLDTKPPLPLRGR